jgi:hypothetical protein
VERSGRGKDLDQDSRQVIVGDLLLISQVNGRRVRREWAGSWALRKGRVLNGGSRERGEKRGPGDEREERNGRIAPGDFGLSFVVIPGLLLASCIVILPILIILITGNLIVRFFHCPQLSQAQGSVITVRVRFHSISNPPSSLSPSVGPPLLQKDSIYFIMSNTSRPPGLDDDLPPGLANQERRRGPDTSSQPKQTSAGRGSSTSRASQQNNQAHGSSAGRGKKKEAKATAATSNPAPAASKPSNLASFDDSLSGTMASVNIETTTPAPSAGAKRGTAKMQSKSSASTVPPTSWIPKHLPTESEQIACLICCEPIEFYAIGECNHNEICGLCTIRRRQIYKEMDCCICKQPLEHIVVDRESSLKFNELFENRNRSHLLTGSTITINDAEYFAYCESLFERYCPVCADSHTHRKAFPSVAMLKKHVENVHRQSFCELCLEHRKCFLHEQKLYTPEQLPGHVEKGDPSIQLKPHPSCDYCHTVFYSVEDLFRHCEEAHFKCFLCERENILYNYFRNYDHLEQHFNKKHHACHEKECLEKKFVVFSTALDLQAHNVATHLPQGKGSAKNARVVHLDFGADAQQQQQRSRSLARPAQMPVFYPDRYRPPQQKKEQEVTMSLAGKIDEPKPVTTVVRASQSSSSPVSASPAAVVPPPPLSNLTIAERSKILIANIKAYLNNEAKFNKFRTLSAEFRNSKIGAQSYYSQFVQTFGDDPQAWGLFEEMVEILPDQQKQIELRILRDTDTCPTRPWNLLPVQPSSGSMASRIAASTGSSSGYAGAASASSQSSGRQPTVTHFASKEDFPTLSGRSSPSSTATSFTTHYGNLVPGKPAAATEEAFPSLPSEGKSSHASTGPKGAWGNGGGSVSVVAGKKGKKGKGKQKIFLN